MNTVTLRLISWLGVLSLVPVLLWLTLVRTPQVLRDLQATRQQVAQEQQRLTLTLKDLNDQFTHEQDRYARILRRFPWLAGPSEGTAFLTRLGEVVTGLSLKIMGIGVVQSEAMRQLEKLGRPVRVTGRFVDSLRLVENVEQSKGFVEELKIQRLQPKSGTEAAEEIEAQFRLSSVQLTPDVRQHLRAFINALPDSAKPAPLGPDGVAPLSMPVPVDPQYVASLRDPFRPLAASPKQGPQVEASVAPEFPDLLLAGIVASPTGRTAIINKRSVKEGERVEGILVETIRTSEVVLRSSVGSKRLILPEFGATSPLH